MSRQKSIQYELNRWIVITAFVFVLISGVVAGGIAFYQARELQDHTLLEISALVSAGKLNDSAMIHHNIEEETVIINELGKKQHVPVIPLNINDGLHTMELDGNNWRVFITTQKSTQRRFSIAQQTELRNKIALSSSLSVFLPIVLLVIIMLIIIRLIIRKQFLLLGNLATAMDQQDGSNPKEIPDKDVPIEVMPFVVSINALLERVRQTMNKQQRFIADAAHELRTPITALSLQIENASSAKNPKDIEARQQQLHQGIDRLRVLVTQLLDLARLQNNSENQTQKVSLNKTVQEILGDLFPLAEEAKIDLGVVRQEDDIYLNDINGRLNQLIYNAIGNAIHYTPEEGKVDISLYLKDKKAIFVVEDNGIGIPEEELESVFQPFYRVQESDKPGNGLGLAISLEIAQQLGGMIHLENREGGGLRFIYEQGKL